MSRYAVKTFQKCLKLSQKQLKSYRLHSSTQRLPWRTSLLSMTCKSFNLPRKLPRLKSLISKAKCLKKMLNLRPTHQQQQVSKLSTKKSSMNLKKVETQASSLTSSADQPTLRLHFKRSTWWKAWTCNLWTIYVLFFFTTCSIKAKSEESK